MADGEGYGLATKDLFDRFVKLRDATRWAAFYLIAVAVLLLAWSRSPEWSFKMPFELFVNGKEPLALPSGFAPIFGPIILLFFYLNLYVLFDEAVSVVGVLTTRLPAADVDRTLLGPPFECTSSKPIESFMFVVLLLGGAALSTLWLVGDFFLLNHAGKRMWVSLYEIGSLWNVVPEHRGHAAGASVYGFVQPWLYVALTAFELWILWVVFTRIRSYGDRMSSGKILGPNDDTEERLPRLPNRCLK